MPYREKVSGIYRISTPAGSHYVGSSEHIFRRWAEHKCWLRGGYHHSARLQNAYRKYKSELVFAIVERCSVKNLNDREQFWIQSLGAKLNTSQFVQNIWLDGVVREKLLKIYRSDEYRQKRREMALGFTSRWVPVVCSDGREFRNMAEAARAFGIRTAGIKHLVESQHLGRLGVRFRRASEEWRPLISLSEKLIAGRKRNGTNHHSEASKIRMSLAKKGRKMTPAHRKNMEHVFQANRRPVIGICRVTGATFEFPSQRDAAQFVRPEKFDAAGSQISKVLSGAKKSAYGYDWVRA